MNIIAQTPRIIIRQFLPDEEETLVNLYRDKDVARHISGRTDDDSRRKFKETMASYKTNPVFNRWAIVNPENGDFIGICKLMSNDTDDDKIELGYVLAKKYWGKGLATELAKTLVDYGFNNGLTEICAYINPENIASQNVLLKAGLKRDGEVFWHDKHLPFFRITK